MPYLLLGGVLAAALLACALLTPLARSAAARCGLVDRPDARRKMHARPVPLAGGVAVLAATTAALGAALLFSDDVREAFAGAAPQFLGLLLAAVVICALGVLDDFGCVRGRHKLLGQVLAITILAGFGLQIHRVHLFGTDFELGPFAVPVTYLWMLGAVNSLNLLDGMDGMLGSVGVVIALAMAALAVLGGHGAAALVAVALAGALLGFLCYNLPPASVFLGDAGSMLVGLVIGALGIQSSLKAPATVALVAPVAFLAIPFFDTLAAITRRKLTGRSIYTTDRGHLHHCLLRRGLPARQVLLLVSSCCVLTAVGGLAGLALRNELIAVVVTAAVLSILVAARLFGHAEAELVAKRLLRLVASFWPGRPAGRGRRFEVRLQGSAEWKDLLETMAGLAFDLNLRSVRLDVDDPARHEEYHGEWDRFDDEADGPLLWRVEIPLSIQDRTVGRLWVSGFHDAEPLADKVVRITTIMQDFETALCREESADPVVLSGDSGPVPPRLADGRVPRPYAGDARRTGS